jgi:hypothetical protein
MEGRALAQADSRRPVTAEAWVSPCGITEWHWGRFCSDFFGFPCQYHSTVALHTRIIWGMNNSPTGDRSSETWSQPIDMKNSMEQNSSLEASFFAV